MTEFTELKIYADGDWRVVGAEHDIVTELHTAAGAEAWDVLGASEADTLAWLAATANPGAAAALLRTDASGHVSLVRLNLSENLVLGGDAGLTRHAANQLGPLSGDAIRSSTYTSGVAGYLISDSFAEFANARIRGELHAAVFVKDMIDAHAGTLMVGKSAGSLAADMAVPGSGTWYMYLKDPPGGGFLFANGDICYIKSEYSGGVAAIWFTVSARADMGNGTQRYTCTYNSGTRGITYPAGAPVTDWGVSGDGVITLSADGTIGAIPNMSIITHAGAPWATQTLRGRWGNMSGSYGVTGGYHGLGVGDYAGGNYLKYDTGGGFEIKAGDGGVTIDENGIDILGDVLTFTVGGDRVGLIRALTWGTISSLRIEAVSPTLNPYLVLSAAGGGSGNQIDMILDTVNSCVTVDHGKLTANEVDVRIQGGLYVGSVATNPAMGDVVATADGRFGGGLYVGSVVTNPAPGTITATGTITAARHIAKDPTNWGFLVDMSSTGGWAGRGFGFGNGATRLGGFDAYGSGASIIYFYVGTSYNDSGAVRFYPATGDVRTAGGLYVGSLAGDPAAGWGYFVNGLYVGDTANANQTKGLTINQGSATDEILALKNSGVAHGMTAYTETDTFARFAPAHTSGGLAVSGLRGDGDSIAVAISGWLTNAVSSTKSTSGYGAVIIQGGVKSDTGVGPAAANGNLLSICNYTTTRFIFDADGDLHLDSVAVQNAWDDHDDIALLHGLRAAAAPQLRQRWGQFIQEARPVLEATGVATFNENGEIWYGVRALQMLTVDALRQFAVRTEARLERYERELLRLGADPQALLN